jgi:hypothetical protein
MTSTSHKEKAEAYVRSKIPELMELSFGCAVVVDCGTSGRWKALVTGLMSNGDWRVNLLEEPVKEKDLEIIGHPIQLQHWLRVLENKIDGFESDKGELLVYGEEEGMDWDISFSLKTGQPVDEESYKQFLTIVGEDKELTD